MILNDQDINFFVASVNLIDAFDVNNLRKASYDLRVGSEYFMCDPLRAPQNGYISPLSSLKLTPGQSFEIPSNSVCYILSKEKIHLPLDISAKVSLRLSFIYHGLMLAAQPPFDPGYNGFVIVMLHNLANRPFPIKEGERLATIEFFRLSNPASPTTAASRSVVSLGQSLKGRVVTSLQHLEVRILGAEKKVNRFFGQLVGLLAVLLAIPTAIAYVQFSFLDEKLADQKAQIEAQSKLMERQQNAANATQNQMRATIQKLCAAQKMKPCITDISH